MSEDLLERLWRLQLEPAVGGEVLDATLSVAEGQALQGTLHGHPPRERLALVEVHDLVEA